jgi:hypothetical protein
MVIHFAASRKSALANFEVLRTIITVIHESGHVLARDWVEPFRAISKNRAQDLTSEDLYKLSIDAIARAELVIVEASEASFGSGFQVATALARKKPVLILIDDSVERQPALMEGISDSFLVRKTYTQTTLPRIVKDFIQENTFSTKDLRFNFVIDRQIYNYLRWKSFKLNKTKGEIVRELLLKDIEKDLPS